MEVHDKKWFCILQWRLAGCLQYDSLKTFYLIYGMTSSRKGVQLWKSMQDKYFWFVVFVVQ